MSYFSVVLFSTFPVVLWEFGGGVLLSYISTALEIIRSTHSLFKSIFH